MKANLKSLIDSTATILSAVGLNLATATMSYAVLQVLYQKKCPDDLMYIRIGLGQDPEDFKTAESEL